MTSIIALIPARSGSKGVPNKNMRDLGGHSLLSWSIHACLKSKLIQRIIVSTDSSLYAEHAISLGAEAPFLRPAHLACDNATDLGFVDHALKWLNHRQEKPDYIVHVRPTTPLRQPAVLDDGIAAFIANTSATALRSVHLMSESAYKAFEISPDGLLCLLGSKNADIESANAARQLFPSTYSANGYVDVLSVGFIESTGLMHGSRVMPFLTPCVDEVDTEEDLLRLSLKVSLDDSHASCLFGAD